MEWIAIWIGGMPFAWFSVKHPLTDETRAFRGWVRIALAIGWPLYSIWFLTCFLYFTVTALRSVGDHFDRERLRKN